MWKLWSRRDFLKTAGVWAGAGLLQPVMQLVGSGKSMAAAYPEEVLSIEKYTKGKVKPGDIISKENADLIQDICTPGLMAELVRGNTKIKIADPIMDINLWIPEKFNEATLRNQGQAVLDKKGNLWHKSGEPWIGGNPFPAAQTALEIMWNWKFSQQKYDDVRRASKDTSIDTHGTKVREYLAAFMTIQTVGRLWCDPKPVVPEFKNENNRSMLVMLYPFDVYGFAVVTTTYNDETKFPDTDLYIPALRRTRRVPASNRFDSASPYSAMNVSDLGNFSDPILTWDFKIVARKPMLCPGNGKYNTGGRNKDAQRGDFTFPDCGNFPDKLPNSTWEFRPEVIFLDGTTHLPGCPYSKIRVYYDPTIQASNEIDKWDLAGKLYKHLVVFWGPTGKNDKEGKPIIDLTGEYFGDLQRDYHTNITFYNEHSGARQMICEGNKTEDWMTPAALIKRARR